MDNYEIADQFSLLSQLMDIHGENSFKAKSYASAAFTIEKLPTELVGLSKEKINALKGIGDSVGNKISEIIETGELSTLKDLISKTPEGVLEMLNVKGLGPKKIHTIWKEVGIDSIEELIEACEKNKLATKKGFTENTQKKILESIAFKTQNTNRYLYAQVEIFVEAFTLKIKEVFKNEMLEVTGAFRRQLEVIEELEWVTTISKNELKDFVTKSGFEIIKELPGSLTINAGQTPAITFHISDEKNFYLRVVETSSSDEFLKEWKETENEDKETEIENEEDIFKLKGCPFIPAYLRETKEIIAGIKNISLENIIQTADVKGLIHSHSNWSDGGYTIEQMANALIKLGFEYLVISDHSKAAYYAGGLSEERILEQHEYVDILNKKLKPFKIFKSIECDILSDGSLDYNNEVLASFDLVITSIHSNLQMNEQKAMKRLLGAIENPYVTILGHLTGRRLLKRNAYPVDHKTIIEACAANLVAIEINANPQRLDMKWEWIDYALKNNLFLSINPDAHTIDEFQNIKYGVLVAQKGGLTKENNLSSLDLTGFEKFLTQRKKLKGISHNG
jgi:DNA polymerase (family 10)